MDNDTSEGTCYICGHGNPEFIQEHHIVPRRYDGADSGRNLVDLCPSCHDAVERIYDDSFFEELGVEKVSQTDSTNVCGRVGCTSTDTYLIQETPTHTLYLCDGHRRCNMSDCHKIGDAIDRYDEKGTVQACSEHRVCGRNGCLSTDVIAFEFEIVGWLILCEKHGMERIQSSTHFGLVGDSE